MIYNVAALSVAFFWACSGVVSFSPTIRFGSLIFNLMRLSLVLLAFFVLSLILYGLDFLLYPDPNILYFIISGILGLVLGDSFLFIVLGRIGPGRTSILYTMNAPITMLYSIVFYDESYNFISLLGIFLVCVGVFLAIVSHQLSKAGSLYDKDTGNRYSTLLFAVVASVGQTLGLASMKYALNDETSLIVANFWRTLSAVIGFFIIIIILQKRSPDKINLKSIFFNYKNPQVIKDYFFTAFNGLIGVALGNFLIAFALSGGYLGIVSTLSSTAPIYTLFILWFLSKQRPNLGAFLAVFLSVAGIAMIFNG